MEFYFCSKYLYKNLFLSGQIGNKDHTFINDLSSDGNAFSHCKGGKDRSDPKTFDVTEEEACHTGSCKQADNVKRNLNDWIFLLYDLRQLAWKKVGRNDWQSATVGKCDTDTDQYICRVIWASVSWMIWFCIYIFILKLHPFICFYHIDMYNGLFRYYM